MNSRERRATMITVTFDSSMFTMVMPSPFRGTVQGLRNLMVIAPYITILVKDEMKLNSDIIHLYEGQEITLLAPLS